MSDWYCSAPSYAEIEKYIAEGLPEGHVLLGLLDYDYFDEGSEHEDEDYNDENMLNKGSKKRKSTAASKKKKAKTVEKDRRVWFDSDMKNCKRPGKFEGYPPNVLYSARFRDGLCADDDVYPSFDLHFDGAAMSSSSSNVCWHEQFFFHSQVEFDFLYALGGGGVDAPCPTSAHGPILSFGKLVSGHRMSYCRCTDRRLSFLFFAMDNIEGFQSQRLMRDKLYLVLHDEARHLPKHHTTAQASKAENRDRWLHSLQVVLQVFNRYDIWLTTKFFSTEDNDYLFEELLPRVKQAMSHLSKVVKGQRNVFDSKEVRSYAIYCI